MNIIAAVASDDGESTIKRHFGSAEQYDLYQVTKEKITFLKTIKNTSEDEDEKVHADPKKAGSVAQLLKQNEVNTTVAKVFGPNLKRIKSNFVCIIVQDTKIKEALKKIQADLDNVIKEWEKGGERSFLRMKDKEE